MKDYIKAPDGVFLLPPDGAGPDLFFELYEEGKGKVYCAAQMKFQQKTPAAWDLARKVLKKYFFGGKDLQVKELLKEVEVIPIVIAFPRSFSRNEDGEIQGRLDKHQREEIQKVHFFGKGSGFFTKVEENAFLKAHGLISLFAKIKIKIKPNDKNKEETHLQREKEQEREKGTEMAKEKSMFKGEGKEREGEK